VLTLLAVLGASFAQLMRLEKRASENFKDSFRMDFLTNSALDRVIARFFDSTNHYSWTFYNNVPWLLKFRHGYDADDLAHGRVQLDEDSQNRVADWVNFADVGGKTFRYKAKVIDTNAQINLNGRQDTLARMLDNLGDAIDRSDRLKREAGRVVTNPFYFGPKRSGGQVFGAQILQFRQRLEGQRFQSKSQLRQLIGDENYEIVKDFVTTHSWEDPYTYRADDGENEVRDLAGGLTSPRAGGGGIGGSGAQIQPPVTGSPRASSEPRHPININTAPEEVLIACFQGLACRRVFPYSRLGVGGSVVQIDQNAQILGTRPIGQEEVLDVSPRPVFVYSQPLGPEHARSIVQQIVARRKNAKLFFRTWRTNREEEPGFEDFIDSLDAEPFFPSPQNCLVIDPDQPDKPEPQSVILNSGIANPVGRVWADANFIPGEQAVRRKLGLSVHANNGFYYEMIKGGIKANFNPNTRFNRYNPNVPAYVPVDKSDLVLAEPPRGQQLRKGHTTEFCFDSMGIFEITVLGEMLANSKPDSRTAVKGAAAGTAAGLYPFRRQLRSIVKVFDVLRHTSQFQFEKTFNSGLRSSQADRKYVVTWPEPINALTDLYSPGTRRDGRIELAGLLDGLRQQTSFQNRFATLSQGLPESIIALHSFSERDSMSIAELRRALQTGGLSVFGDQTNNALKDVYDFNYSRFQKTNREFYRIAQLLQLGAVFTRPDAKWSDPLINREELGTDLYPDGLHSGLARVSQNGNRNLVLPARQKIGEAGLGAGNPRVGASGRESRSNNLLGNVAYYRGGLAFWVKFEFDGSDPVFSGLIGCTQVIKEVIANAQDYTGSEGTQFFIFRNTSGQLRVVRMYYHQAFLEGTGGAGDGGGGEGGIALYPNPGFGQEGGQVAAEQNPILPELDQEKWISRSDIVINTRHYRAHEWHHIAVDWDDRNIANPIRVFIDFKPVPEGGLPTTPQQFVDGTANSWVRLNERQPKDGLQVGGIVREQGAEDSGIFKWFTNTFADGKGNVRLIAKDVKRILANATIDELVTYDGTFEEVRSYFGGGVARPGYFSNQTGEYANLMEIPLPPEVDHVVLRSFDWTSYYPTTFTDSLTANAPPAELAVTPIQCEVTYDAGGGALPSPFTEPWRRPSTTNDVAGRQVYRRAGSLRTASGEFVYKFRMRGALSQTGNTTGGVVQTPVIDDVTLTYYLPSPKILLQEEDS
jgi:hypothetical protein